MCVGGGGGGGRGTGRINSDPAENRGELGGLRSLGFRCRRSPKRCQHFTHSPKPSSNLARVSLLDTFYNETSARYKTPLLSLV